MKKLTLKREALSDLTDEQLTGVNAGAATQIRTACVQECVYTVINLRDCYAHTAFDCLTRACA